MVGARASCTVSNGHFCSARHMCFVVIFQGACLKLSTSVRSRGGRRSIRPGIASKNEMSATNGASMQRMPTSS